MQRAPCTSPTSKLDLVQANEQILTTQDLNAMTKPAKVKASADNSEHEHSDKTDEGTNSETKETTQSPQDLRLERKQDTQQSNRVPCGKVQIRIIHMKQDTRQLIIQPERNNNFRKIILDTYDCKRRVANPPTFFG